ncbi:UvrB/UvrC motif-containing protein, partial [Bacillus tropicus]|uniref:UvrB/UvrC motif-containing protein n=1 Tax=Bacillus tropicus TaxID=2026188 RepID=UPI002842FCD6
AYNKEHGITPKTIQKGVRDVIRATTAAEEPETYEATPAKKMTKKESEKTIAKMEAEKKEAAKARDFERAAERRDVLLEVKAEGGKEGVRARILSL